MILLARAKGNYRLQLAVIFSEVFVFISHRYVHVTVLCKSTGHTWKPRRMTCSIHGIRPHNYHDVIKWKHSPCHWPFVRGTHGSPVNFPGKDKSHGASINGWVNNRGTGDLGRHRVHYDVILMILKFWWCHSLILLYANTFTFYV